MIAFIDKQIIITKKEQIKNLVLFLLQTFSLVLCSNETTTIIPAHRHEHLITQRIIVDSECQGKSENPFIVIGLQYSYIICCS